MSEKHDPFEELAKVANRQAAETKMLERITRARKTLIFGRGPGAPPGKGDCAFWASLVLRIKVATSWDIETMATDGKNLFCNPDFVNHLSDAEVVGVLAHETFHCANAHHSRMGPRDPGRWNIAADLSENPLLEAGGFTLPSCRLMPAEGDFKNIPRDLSAEEIYAKLPQEPPPEAGGRQGDDPGGCGGVKRPGDGSESAAAEEQAKWKVAVAQAHQVAKQRGQLSAGLERLVNEILQPTVDWKEVLREFVTKNAKTDYKWTPPNRRFVAQGLYLPARSGVSIGEIVVAVDESGSIGANELSIFAGEIEGILQAYEGIHLTILHHGAAVNHVQEWSPEDGPLVLEPRGGGGTDHRPVFDWIEEHEIEPACIVALTDLCSVFPKDEPAYPVLWATTVKGSKGPWGQTVEVGS